MDMGDNMNKKLRLYAIAGILFVSVIGSLSHFLYEWSGGNGLIGLVSPVNESTWEHVKLLFFPMLVYAIFMTVKLRSEYNSLFPALLTGILTGCLLIPVIFYTYTGILGFNLLVLDIITFLISVVIAFYVSYRQTLKGTVKKYQVLLLISVVILTILFFVCTYYPPAIGLFQIP